MSDFAGDALESQIRQQVREQIDLHRRSTGERSYLQQAVSAVYNPAAPTLHELVIVQEELERDRGRAYRSVDEKRADSIRQKIADDRQMLLHEQKVSTVVGGALSTAALFLPGAIGWAGGAALSALDGASPHRQWQMQTGDALLGAARGLAFRGVFSLSALLPGGFLTRTAFLAPAQRAIDAALNRGTYLEPETGASDLSAGLSRVARSAFNPYSLGADAGSQMLSVAAAVGLNYLTAGAIGRNQLLGTMVMGGMYGFNASISADVKNFFELGVPLQPAQSLISGAGQALLSAIVAAPGGVLREQQAHLRRADLTAQMQAPPVPGVVNRILVDGREALVRMPRGANADEKLPLVVVLHGTGGSAAEISAKTRLFQKADVHRLILLFPEGNDVLADPSRRVWHIPIFGLAHRTRMAADVRSVATLIGDVQKRYGGDPDRTEIWGMSAGGTLARSVAAAYPERISALGLVAAPHVGSEIPSGIQTTVISGDYLSSGRGLLAALGLRPQGELIQFLQQANGSGSKRVHRAGRVTMQQFTDERGIRITDVHVAGARHSWNGEGSHPDGEQPGPISRLLLSQFLRRARAESPVNY